MDHPVIPNGFSYVTGTPDSGFVIRADVDGSEFVWIPTVKLKADGTVNGRAFDRQFGARDYGYSGVPGPQMDETLRAQDAYVKAHGGFYISRYTAGRVGGERPVFNGEGKPWVNLSRQSAERIVAGYGEQLHTSCHLPYAVEQDTVFAWLIQNGCTTEEQIRMSAKIRDHMGHTEEIVSPLKHAAYQMGLCNFAGTVDEWTKDSVDIAQEAHCGATCKFPQTSKCYFRKYGCYAYAGFRAVLLLEQE